MKPAYRPTTEPSLGRQQARERRAVIGNLQSGQVMARAWSQTVPERQRKQAAWAFIKAAIDEYIDVLAQTSGAQIRVTAPAIAFPVSLDTPVVELARNIAREVAELQLHRHVIGSATHTRRSCRLLCDARSACTTRRRC